MVVTEDQIENLREDVKAIGQTVSDILVRLDRHDSRFDRHDARFDQIDRRLDAHDARFDQIDGRFDEVDETLREILAVVRARP